MYTATKIKALRISKGLTQRQLAEKLGCPQSTIARWESGTKVSPAYIKLIESLEVDKSGFYEK